MSIADIALCLLIALGAWSGYKEGFLMALFSFLAVILGVLGGFKLMGWAMLYLSEHFNVDKNVLPYIAFGVVFVGIVILVKLVGNMIKLSLDKSFLGRVDQVAGAILGIFRAAFMLSVVLWLTDSLRITIPERYTEDSWLLPMIVNFAPGVTGWIAEFFPVFKDVF